MVPAISPTGLRLLRPGQAVGSDSRSLAFQQNAVQKGQPLSLRKDDKAVTVNAADLLGIT